MAANVYDILSLPSSRPVFNWRAVSSKENMWYALLPNSVVIGDGAELAGN